MPSHNATRAPGGAPRRSCGSCGAEAATWGSTCPDCGEHFDGPRLPRRARRALAALVVAVAAAAVAYAAPRIDDARDRQTAAAAHAAATSEAAERVRVTRDQRPVAGRLRARDEAAHPARRRIAVRRKMVEALEAAIRSDARARRGAGTPGRPVRSAACRPLLHTHGGPGDERDLDARTGRFECLATTLTVRSHGRPVARVGQPYVAALDFRTGRYVLCRHHPPPGEGGVMLAQVPLDPSCFGARDPEHLEALGIRESPRD